MNQTTEWHYSAPFRICCLRGIPFRSLSSVFNNTFERIQTYFSPNKVKSYLIQIVSQSFLAVSCILASNNLPVITLVLTFICIYHRDYHKVTAIVLCEPIDREPRPKRVVMTFLIIYDLPIVLKAWLVRRGMSKRNQFLPKSHTLLIQWVRETNIYHFEMWGKTWDLIQCEIYTKTFLTQTFLTVVLLI